MKQSPSVSKVHKNIILIFLDETNLNSLVKSNSMIGNNRSIDSVSNSLYDDHKYNVKQRWLHDGKELSSVGKSIIGISGKLSVYN